LRSLGGAGDKPEKGAAVSANAESINTKLRVNSNESSHRFAQPGGKGNLRFGPRYPGKEIPMHVPWQALKVTQVWRKLTWRRTDEN